MSWGEKIRGRLPAPLGDVCVARSERSSRGWAVAAVTAFSVAMTAGAGMVAKAGAGDADAARSLNAQITEREKRVADLDAERKRREDQLAELTRRVNASESQLAESAERVSSLEKRREILQRQVAELAGPVSPDFVERPPSEAESTTVNLDDASPPDEMTEAAAAPTPPARPAPEEARVRPVKAEPPAPLSRAAVADSDQPDIVAATAAQKGPVRVFIHVRSSDPAARNRARAVAAELQRRGVAVAEIRGVRLPVRRDAVRYFYDQDRSAASILQDAVRESSSPGGAAPLAQDFRSFGAPPRRGTIELWLS
jgi:hypothetical protein